MGLEWFAQANQVLVPVESHRICASQAQLVPSNPCLVDFASQKSSFRRFLLAHLRVHQIKIHFNRGGFLFCSPWDSNDLLCKSGSRTCRVAQSIGVFRSSNPHSPCLIDFAAQKSSFRRFLLAHLRVHQTRIHFSWNGFFVLSPVGLE